jgi:hypothetical protein
MVVEIRLVDGEISFRFLDILGGFDKHVSIFNTNHQPGLTSHHTHIFFRVKVVWSGHDSRMTVMTIISVEDSFFIVFLSWDILFALSMSCTLY